MSKTAIADDIELQPIPDSATLGEDKALLISQHQNQNDVNITQEQENTQKPSINRIVAVVAFYIVTSITMIMVNKVVLRQAALPMTFLWGQLVVAVLLLRGASFVGLLDGLPSVSTSTFVKLKALIALNVIGLALNTLCLQHIDAVLYQVARSLILPMTAALSLITGGHKVSHSILTSCAVITVGFLIGVLWERQVTVSTVGIMFGVLSAAATSVHSFAIKNSFTQVPNKGAFDMVYYNNLFSLVVLLPIVVVFEYSLVLEYWRIHGDEAMVRFLLMTLLAGASGLLINLAGFLQIKVTSPLTHTVSSAARGVLQTVACRMVLGEQVTVARSIGILITLLGSAMYSWFKSKEH